MSDAGQALARTLQSPLPPGFDTVADADLAAIRYIHRFRPLLLAGDGIKRHRHAQLGL